MCASCSFLCWSKKTKNKKKTEHSINFKPKVPFILEPIVLGYVIGIVLSYMTLTEYELKNMQFSTIEWHSVDIQVLCS